MTVDIFQLFSNFLYVPFKIDAWYFICKFRSWKKIHVRQVIISNQSIESNDF